MPSGRSIVRLQRAALPGVDEACMVIRNQDWTLCLVMTVSKEAAAWFGTLPIVYGEIEWTHSVGPEAVKITYLKKLKDLGWPESEPPAHLGIVLDPPTIVPWVH